jgi:hypothetical protein
MIRNQSHDNVYESFKNELLNHVMEPYRLLQISIKYDVPLIELVNIYG